MPTAEELLAVFPFARGDDRTVLLIAMSDHETPSQEWWYELVLGDSSAHDRAIAVWRLDGGRPDDERVLLELLTDRSREIRLSAAWELSERGGPQVADAMFGWYTRTLRPPKRTTSWDLHDVSTGVAYGLRTGTQERAREVLLKARSRLDPEEIAGILSWFPEGLESPWEAPDVDSTLAAVREWRDQNSGSGERDMSEYIANSYRRAFRRQQRS